MQCIGRLSGESGKAQFHDPCAELLCIIPRAENRHGHANHPDPG
jgi:hypothetical protein